MSKEMYCVMIGLALGTILLLGIVLLISVIRMILDDID